MVDKDRIKYFCRIKSSSDQQKTCLLQLSITLHKLHLSIAPSLFFTLSLFPSMSLSVCVPTRPSSALFLPFSPFLQLSGDQARSRVLHKRKEWIILQIKAGERRLMPDQIVRYSQQARTTTADHYRRGQLKGRGRLPDQPLLGTKNQRGPCCQEHRGGIVARAAGVFTSCTDILAGG